MTAQQLSIVLYLLHEMIEYQTARKTARRRDWIKWRVAVRWICKRGRMTPAIVIDALKHLIEFKRVAASADRKKIRPIQCTVE
ncbi:MAG: hypothetical protein ACEQSD_10905 [Flavobacteriales bacterium]